MLNCPCKSLKISKISKILKIFKERSRSHAQLIFGRKFLKKPFHGNSKVKRLILYNHSFAKNDLKNLSEDLCSFRFCGRFRCYSLMGILSRFLASARVFVCMFRPFALPGLSVLPFSGRKKCCLCHDFCACWSSLRQET